jgi:hypothetical protein
MNLGQSQAPATSDTRQARGVNQLKEGPIPDAQGGVPVSMTSRRLVHLLLCEDLGLVAHHLRGFEEVHGVVFPDFFIDEIAKE